MLLLLALAAQTLVRPALGTRSASADSAVVIELIDKRENYGFSPSTHDGYIHSPKSVNIAPSGDKYYINSLEGGTTIAYAMGSNQRLATVSHQLSAATDALWAPASDLYPFTHYPRSDHFMGRPVESCFSHGGRYLWVPYYRRSYDINAQDPSALAVIDTRTYKIVRLMETGPLPKMIAASHDGRTIAVTHWGDNTVGLIDISSTDPTRWQHRQRLVVDHVFPLHYSLTEPVNRDNGSGYALRGTVFTPSDRYLLVGCMGGGGGIAVIDLAQGKYLGRVTGMMDNVRHLVISHNYLYLSINTAGYVQRIPLKDFLHAATTTRRTKSTQWQKAKVGAGARTISVSPSGRFVFAACNLASQLCVVDTRSMRQVAAIDCDSYPVGLDISADGQTLITTSQGRNEQGGNAVCIFRVSYKQPEIVPKPAAAHAPKHAAPTGAAAPSASETDYTLPLIGGIAALVCAFAAYKGLRRG